MTGAQPARVLPPALIWSPAAANELRRLAIEGLLALPNRGVEIGGLLLGSVSERAPYLVNIEQIYPIEAEYRPGPGFVLSGEDHIRLRETLAKTRGSSEHFVVGYYRSHTAPGSQPALDPSDREIISTYFSDPSHVFLAIRPWSKRRCAAALYFWSGGELQTEGPGFELGEEAGVAPDPAEPAEAPPPAPVPASAAVKPAKAFDTAWLSSLAFVLSMAGLFVVDLPRRSPCPAPAVQAAAPPAAVRRRADVESAPAVTVAPVSRRASIIGDLPEAEVPEAILNRIDSPVEVAVRVRVGPDGRVVSAEPARDYPDGLHRYLARQAVSAARAARFRPAVTAAGAAAESTETVGFQFAPR